MRVGSQLELDEQGKIYSIFYNIQYEGENHCNSLGMCGRQLIFLTVLRAVHRDT